MVVTWSEYLRVLAMLVGVGCVWRKREFSLGTVLLAMLLATWGVQWCAASTGSGSVCLLIWGGGVSVGAVGLWLLRSCGRWRLSLLDWTVVGVALFVFVLTAGTGILFELEGTWSDRAQWLLYPVLWVVLRRWMPLMGGYQLWIRRGVLVILALICAAGGVQAGAAYYPLLAGEAAEREAEYETARGYYEKSAERSQALGLEGVYGRSRLGLARSSWRLGERERAATVLGLEEDWGRVIQPDEWEGPAGGHLFKNVSCWKDLWLCQGEVTIEVYARGRPAWDVWPRMQVRLGERLLGEAEVNSQKVKAYAFSAEVGTGTERLEVAFLNDFWKLGVADRSLYIEKGEIAYDEVRW